MFRNSLAAAFAILAVSLPASGRAGEAFPAADQAALEKIVKDGMASQRQPGLIVSIIVPGRGEWTAALGVGDIATGAPMKVDDHVRIASITKTFTAVAVLRLVDQGRLRLDETLETYVPGVPNGERITIRNLLAMRSGIYDFTMDADFDRAFEANPLMPFGLADVLAILKRHPPEAEPDTKVSYCDTNYVFLGAILEKVTGKPAGEVITEEVVAPLGLKETSYPATAAIPEPFAHGYFAGDDGTGDFRDFTASNPAVAATAGAMISTAADLRVWAKALITGALLKPATHAEQIRFGMIATGKGLTVGYGLGIAAFDALEGHNGAILGYSTAMFTIPEFDATIVLAGNQASNFSNATTVIALGIGQYLFPEAMKGK